MKKCFECEAIKDLQEHHVIPRSRGGTKTVTLCHSCHLRAHGRDSKGLSHSRLTKEGIERARKRGAKIGNPNLNAARQKGTQQRRKQGKATAMKYGPKIEILKNEGYSFRKIARKFNELDIQTPTGVGKWYARGIILVYKRYLKEAK